MNSGIKRGALALHLLYVCILVRVREWRLCFVTTETVIEKKKIKAV